MLCGFTASFIIGQYFFKKMADFGPVTVLSLVPQAAKILNTCGNTYDFSLVYFSYFYDLALV